MGRRLTKAREKAIGLDERNHHRCEIVPTNTESFSPLLPSTTHAVCCCDCQVLNQIHGWHKSRTQCINGNILCYQEYKHTNSYNGLNIARSLPLFTLLAWKRARTEPYSHEQKGNHPCGWRKKLLPSPLCVSEKGTEAEDLLRHPTFWTFKCSLSCSQLPRWCLYDWKAGKMCQKKINHTCVRPIKGEWHEAQILQNIFSQ